MNNLKKKIKGEIMKDFIEFSKVILADEEFNRITLVINDYLNNEIDREKKKNGRLV